MTLFCLLLLCLGGKDPHFNACSYSSQDPKRKRNEKKDPLSRQTGIQLTRLPPLHHKKHYASYQPPQSCQHQACGEFYFLHTHTHTHTGGASTTTSRHVTSLRHCYASSRAACWTNFFKSAITFCSRSAFSS